jgi:DNA ligase (NAD+)
MTDEEIQARILELTALVTKARSDYHNGTPTVPDVVYDAWEGELADLDSLNSAITAVGAPPVSEWVKVKHDHPMGSLNKVNTPEEMGEWLQTYAPDGDVVTSEKLDGISIQVKYIKGVLTQASTRGDGKIGEDITVNVRRMKGVPAQVPGKVSCTVRGEIILRKSDFEAHFKDDYANTRNAASGVSKRYDGTKCEYLSILFYKLNLNGKVPATYSLPAPITEVDQFRFLESLGLSTPWWTSTQSPQEAWVEYQMGKRDRIDYDIDGLVTAINNLNKQFALGEKDLRPVGAMAFKFAALTRESTLRGITEQTGATGAITPVANFDAVNLLGAQVSNASLYNWGYIKTLGLDIGAKILVARANDVIPRIVAVVQGTGTIYPPPTKCPSCGGPVVQRGEFHVCLNRDACPAQVIGRISQWLTHLGILEWGDILLEKLVSAGLVKSVPDLYRLTIKQLSGLDRMGDASATKALKLLHEKETLTLDVMLGSLCIPGIAVSTIKLLMAAGYDDMEKLRSASFLDLGKINGIGPVRAETLYGWVKSHSEVVEELASVGVRVQDPIRGKFSGMSFCFTGEMEKKRGDLEEMVRSLGGDVKSSVTKKLTYLVMADTTTGKADTARRYGTKCLSEGEFLFLVGG